MGKSASKALIRMAFAFALLTWHAALMFAAAPGTNDSDSLATTEEPVELRSQVAVVASRQPPTTPSLPELPETIVVGQPPLSPERIEPTSNQRSNTQPEASERPFIDSYFSDQAFSSVLMPVPARDLPFTTNVVNQTLIRDQQAIRLQDLLRNMPGVLAVPSSAADPDQILVRGFPIGQFDTRWNGFLAPPLSQRELANIERIELLKGPSSVLYGGGQPAGVINYVTKQPTTNRFFSAQGQLGSFQFQRYTFDLGGPLTANGAVRGRLNIAEQQSKSFRDFVENKRFFIDPVVAFDLDENTTVTWETEYFHNHDTLDRGIPFYRGQLTGVPIGRFVGEPDDFFDVDDVRTSLRIVHALSDDWKFHMGWSGQFRPKASLSSFQPLLLAPPAFGVPDSNLIRSKASIVSNNEQFHNLNARIEAQSEILGLDHSWVAGGELFSEVVPNFDLNQSNPFSAPLFIDIFDPVYGDTRFGGPNPELSLKLNLDRRQDRFGTFWSDLITINEQWKLLVGVRQDWAKVRQVATSNIPDGFGATAFGPLPSSVTVTSNTTFVATKPRVGVVYQPFGEDHSLYSSYSESFRPAFGRKADGTLLVPELGHQFEGGTKLQLTEQLAASGAAFYLVKQNVIVADPNNVFFQLQLGEQSSRGCEFDLQGKINDDWNVVATYAYVDSRVVNDLRPGLVGNRLINTPLNSGSLWSKHRLLEIDRRSLGAAIGLVGVDRRPADLENSVELPAYARWDAAVYSRHGRWDLNLYFENLFGTRYYQGSESAVRVYPGAPFTVRGSISCTF